MSIFLVAGMGVAALIAVLLISKKAKSAADRILAVWMVLILGHLFLSYLFLTEEVYNFPYMLGIEHPVPLLHGVFLYLYVSLLTNQLPVKRALLILHFLPAAAVCAYLVTFFLLPAEQKIQVYRNHGAGYELFTLMKRYAITLSGILYVTWSAVLLRRHRRNIRDQFSDLEKVNLQWLRILTYGMGVIWLLVILFGNEMLTMGAVVLFVFLIGFFGVRQADIFATSRFAAGQFVKFQGEPGPFATVQDEPGKFATGQGETGEVEPGRVEPGQPAAEGGEQKQKYTKSGLTEEASTKLHRALLQLMGEEALYKKADLSINDLSSKLGVHPNYLSQVINQKERKNFYDFVNTYRIEEFKRMIGKAKNQQFTLLSLAYDCGFSSKSSFNRYFKKVTGQTPSDYATAMAGGQDTPASIPPTD